MGKSHLEHWIDLAMVPIIEMVSVMLLADHNYLLSLIYLIFCALNFSILWIKKMRFNKKSGAIRLINLSSISSVFYSLPFQWMQMKLMIWWSYHVLRRFWRPGDRHYLKVTHRDNYLSLYVTMTRDNHVFCPGFTKYSIICQSITQLNTKGRFWSGFSFKC